MCCAAIYVSSQSRRSNAPTRGCFSANHLGGKNVSRCRETCAGTPGRWCWTDQRGKAPSAPPGARLVRASLNSICNVNNKERNPCPPASCICRGDPRGRPPCWFSSPFPSGEGVGGRGLLKAVRGKRVEEALARCFILSCLRHEKRPHKAVNLSRLPAYVYPLFGGSLFWCYFTAKFR